MLLETSAETFAAQTCCTKISTQSPEETHTVVAEAAAVSLLAVDEDDDDDDGVGAGLGA